MDILESGFERAEKIFILNILMPNYTINNNYVGINIGTFSAIANTVSFINGISTDGWVLCDGIPRDNTNNKFNILISMGIGLVHNTTFYKPPDLTGRIMIGTKCTDNPFNLNTYQGAFNNEITLSLANLPAHTHTITIGSSTHTHMYSDETPTVDSRPDNQVDQQGATGDRTANGFLGVVTRTTGTANDSHSHTVTINDPIVESGSIGQSFSIKNNAFHIQWIVKYI
jgi:microcystin-dependent protein